MATLNHERQEQQRWTIGSIRGRWRLLFSIFYVAQALPGIAFIVWLELTHATTDSAIDTIRAIIWGIAVVGGASVATTVALVEVQELMLGTRDIINDWLQKRRDEAKAEGEERGEKRGLSKAQDWYSRQQAARERGEPFDEPPPWDDEPKD